jgi:hypothetical protein
MADSWVAMTRRRALTLMVGGLVGTALVAAGCGSDDPGASSRSHGSGLASDPPARPPEGEAVIYASPTCGCCGDYATYLESEGWAVSIRRTEEMDAVKAEAGVPDEAASCHTTMVGDYAVEGHVPVDAIDKLLRERPPVEGIALPGMPPGSPGMTGEKAAPFEIVSFDAGAVQPFMTL